MEKIFKIIIFLTLVILFLSGALYTTYEWRMLQPYMLIGSTTLIFFLNCLYKNSKFRVDLRLLLLFFVYILVSILSALLNSDFELFIGMLLLIYMYISLVIVLPSLFKNGENGKSILALALLSGHFSIIIPDLFKDISFKSYAGIFYNPNSFGTVVATIFAVVLAKGLFYLELYIKGERFKKKKLFLFLLLSTIMFFLIIISSSRTSFITAIILIIISIFFLIKNIKLKYAKRTILLILFSMVILIIINNFTSFDEILQGSIFNKFQAKRNDLLDGRLSLWITVLKETRIFGYGRSYFAKFGLGAHNTFISILGQYGLFALLFFILFLIKLFISEYKYAVKAKDDAYKYLPLFALISFILLSIGEGMMLKTSMILMFSTIGFIDIGKQYRVSIIKHRKKNSFQ